MFFLYTRIVSRKVTSSSASRCSLLRISAFRGSRYAPAFLSGKIDVCHDVFPIVTTTGSEPHPFARAPKCFLISSDCFFGTEIKCQPAIPGYNHIFDFSLNSFFATLIDYTIGGRLAVSTLRSNHHKGFLATFARLF